MNLEQLRKQAKELVKAARAGDPAALERLGGREPILARAQLVLAREHGYPSWAALVAAADASVETFVRAATTGRRTEGGAASRRPSRARTRRVDRARARPRVAWRPGHRRRAARLGAASLRVPLVLRHDLTRAGAARPRRRPERVLRQRIRPDVRALRRRGRPLRPGADTCAARGRREPRRRRVALPRDRGGEPRVRRDPARARRADRRDERAGARARQRAPGARPAPARPRHRPERGGMSGPRRSSRTGCGDDRAPGSPRRRPRPAGRRDVARRRPAAHALPARRSAREGRPGRAARPPRRVDRGRSRGHVGRAARPRGDARQASRPPRSTWTCRRF